MVGGPLAVTQLCRFSQPTAHVHQHQQAAGFGVECRSAPGQDAICLVEVDGQVPDAVIDAISKLPPVKMAKALAF